MLSKIVSRPFYSTCLIFPRSSQWVNIFHSTIFNFETQVCSAQVSLSLVALAAGQVQIEGSPEWQVIVVVVSCLKYLSGRRTRTPS